MAESTCAFTYIFTCKYIVMCSYVYIHMCVCIRTCVALHGCFAVRLMPFSLCRLGIMMASCIRSLSMVMSQGAASEPEETGSWQQHGKLTCQSRRTSSVPLNMPRHVSFCCPCYKRVVGQRVKTLGQSKQWAALCAASRMLGRGLLILLKSRERHERRPATPPPRPPPPLNVMFVRIWTWMTMPLEQSSIRRPSCPDRKTSKLYTHLNPNRSLKPKPWDPCMLLAWISRSGCLHKA